MAEKTPISDTVTIDASSKFAAQFEWTPKVIVAFTNKFILKFHPDYLERERIIVIPFDFTSEENIDNCEDYGPVREKFKNIGRVSDRKLWLGNINPAKRYQAIHEYIQAILLSEKYQVVGWEVTDPCLFSDHCGLD